MLVCLAVLGALIVLVCSAELGALIELGALSELVLVVAFVARQQKIGQRRRRD